MLWLLYAICGWGLGRPISVPPTIGIAAAMSLVCAVAIVLYPVYLFPDGLRCYNYWGIYQTAKWEDIQGVRATSVFGMRYLVIQTTCHSEIYLPLWLSGMSEFIRVVQAAAGNNHVLTKALMNTRL